MHIIIKILKLSIDIINININQAMMHIIIKFINQSRYITNFS